MVEQCRQELHAGGSLSRMRLEAAVAGLFRGRHIFSLTSLLSKDLCIALSDSAISEKAG